MATTRHSCDGAINVLRNGVFLKTVGYTNSVGDVGVIAQDEAIDYLVSEGYNAKYANRVLSDAFNRGDVGRIGRGLYLLNTLVC